jgi:enamine deaminase RidA (YjgF/YER057c/UK114 family)
MNQPFKAKFRPAKARHDIGDGSTPQMPLNLREQHRHPHHRCPMPSIQHFAPPAGIKSPPLSFATRVGDLLFISGIPGFDDKGALPETFEAQFGFVVRNIKRVLDEAGATFRDLVKVNVLLTRLVDVSTMNVLYASAFGPAPYPARTTCVVQALPDPKMLIEIEGVASLAGR